MRHDASSRPLVDIFPTSRQHQGGRGAGGGKSNFGLLVLQGGNGEEGEKVLSGTTALKKSIPSMQRLCLFRFDIVSAGVESCRPSPPFAGHSEEISDKNARETLSLPWPFTMC